MYRTAQEFEGICAWKIHACWIRTPLVRVIEIAFENRILTGADKL